ncbi:MAG: hypothetical protein UY62_C0091G0006 [Parcubacteria group bacterium GW2011_GWF2_50_9]|nr:MAG: hypothetical protein UY62_C0091G0006 [Parcubacteria group bacterium GW2011_GWF2_50_9]
MLDFFGAFLFYLRVAFHWPLVPVCISIGTIGAYIYLKYGRKTERPIKKTAIFFVGFSALVIILTTAFFVALEWSRRS